MIIDKSPPRRFYVAPVLTHNGTVAALTKSGTGSRPEENSNSRNKRV